MCFYPSCSDTVAPFLDSVRVFYSAGLSFTDWDMISAQINFIGMDNYKSLLGDPEFYRTLKNTLFFSIGNIIPYHFIWCTDCIGTLYSETGWLF